MQAVGHTGGKIGPAVNVFHAAQSGTRFHNQPSSKSEDGSAEIPRARVRKKGSLDNWSPAMLSIVYGEFTPRAYVNCSENSGHPQDPGKPCQNFRDGLGFQSTDRPHTTVAVTSVRRAVMICRDTVHAQPKTHLAFYTRFRPCCVIPVHRLNAHDPWRQPCIDRH